MDGVIKSRGEKVAPKVELVLMNIPGVKRRGDRRALTRSSATR